MSKKAIVGSVKEACGVGRLRVQDKTLSGRMKKEKKPIRERKEPVRTPVTCRREIGGCEAV